MTQPLAAADMERLTRSTLEVLHDWGLDHTHEVALLGLPMDTKARVMVRHRQGEALPQDEDLLLRSRCILEIGHALHSAFPHNPNLAHLWVTTVSPRFGDRSPLQVMLEEGLPGMERILSHLQGHDTW